MSFLSLLKQITTTKWLKTIPIHYLTNYKVEVQVTAQLNWILCLKSHNTKIQVSEKLCSFLKGLEIIPLLSSFMSLHKFCSLWLQDQGSHFLSIIQGPIFAPRYSPDSLSYFPCSPSTICRSSPSHASNLYKLSLCFLSLTSAYGRPLCF